MTPRARLTLFALFFLSGFSSLIYQVVWTRMAFASFGIIAPVLSVVLSVFMLGLAVGSWAGGRLIGPITARTGLSAAAFYGLAELLIGVGAFAVPASFSLSARLLLPAGQVDSLSYLAWSAVALGVSIFPWCVCMGVTFPFMMAHVRERDAANADSFSFLYLANVLGAMAGTLLTAVVFVELLGFRRTLWVAAGSNFAIAAVGVGLGLRSSGRVAAAAGDPAPVGLERQRSDRFNLAVLFTTGFVSMAMEVVWSRGFATVLKTQVYSFALIVFTYLGATFVGSAIYRRDARAGRVRSQALIFFGLAVAAVLPAIVNDPAFVAQHFQDPLILPGSATLILGSLCPLCAILGYLTPRLIDGYSGGNPRRAGGAYAANVIGCILGPLAACYLLLPHAGNRQSLVALALPFIAFWAVTCRTTTTFRRALGSLAIVGTFAYAAFSATDFEESLVQRAPNASVRRDYIASVTAFGTRRDDKWLLVNGVGMTNLTPITKFIAHLPLSLHRGPPRSMLVICFGMGTTYRSALTWGIDVTAVELVPSVPKDFGFFHADAERVLADPNGHIVIDDGRRYLSRCARKFDVIVVDPPPPITAAGSSLLFSTEFYALAKRHLNPGGIVQMWYPGGQTVAESGQLTGQAVLRSIHESFPHVACYTGIEGWGVHLLGSMDPVLPSDPQQMAARMPPAARADLVEWTDRLDAPTYLKALTRGEVSVPDALNPDRRVEVTDDRPFNEYYLLRTRAAGPP